MDRPTGVYIIAFLEVFMALYLLTVSFFNFTMGTTANETTVAVFTLIVGLLLFGLSAATWIMKPWTWTVNLIGLVLVIVRDLYAYFVAGHYFGILTFTISVILIYYLTRPEIRTLYGHGKA